MAARCLFTIIMLTWTFTITVAAAVPSEVCQWETFKAQCQDDEVILMKSAHYGRMHVGRCQPRDYFVGCSADVISIMHARCSGRQHCSVQIPDADMFAATNCNKDLVSYLEADYECVKVNKPSEDNCDHQIVTSLTGYISKPDPTIFRNPCPLHIVAQPGQTVNVYLYGFTNQHSDIEAKFYQPKCISYGNVSEENVNPTKICGGEIKSNKLIYSSKSNIVDIALVSNNTNNFLVRYEVIGCQTLKAPQHAQLKIEKDIATITCDYSRNAVTLVCSGNQWIGEFKNCTMPSGPVVGSMTGNSMNNIFTRSSFAVLCVGLALGVVCSVSFLILALRYLNGQQGKKQDVIDASPSDYVDHHNDFTNVPSIDVSIKPIDQYQQVYVPFKINANSQVTNANQLSSNMLSTFQTRVNLPVIANYVSTLENRIVSNENKYGQLRPILDCGHTIYDVSDLRKDIREDEHQNIVNIV